MHKLTPLRVAIADGSPFMRRLLAESLLVRGFEVAGVADSPQAAVDLCLKAKPDTLTFDLVSQGMEGVALMQGLREAELQVPVVLLSGHFRTDAYRTVDTLMEGALDFLERPPACDTVQIFLSELAETLRLSVHLNQRRRLAVELVSERSVHALPGVTHTPPRRDVPSEGQRAVLIVGSVGGAHSLVRLIPALPVGLGLGTVVVQQLPEGFTGALAERINRVSTLDVREAQGGEQLDPNVVFFAPGGSHLRLAGESKLLVSTEAPIGGLRPRADLTIDDASRMFGERLVLVVLSGMGKDAVDGARAVKNRGGCVLVEAESTAIASGTPRAVIEARLVDQVVGIDELPEAIAVEAGVKGGLAPAVELADSAQAFDRSA